MKVRLEGVRKIYIEGAYIRLDALLKLSALVSTGGEAKISVQNGDVIVDDEVCFQRNRKISPGNIVRFRGDTLIVVSGGVTFNAVKD